MEGHENSSVQYDLGDGLTLSAGDDLKDDLFRLDDYRKLLKKKPKDTILKEQVRRLSAANAYLIGVRTMDHSLSSAMKKATDATLGAKYRNIRKYLIFRIQSDALDWRKWSYDCDRSLKVKRFYHALGYKEKFEKNNKYEYYDTYFSLQTFWGEFIEKFHGKKYRDDYKWQLVNFDEIILKKIEKSEMKKELENLMKAFDDLARDYHTIGNIAPCAPSINKPKGNINNHAYDRIDLFLKKLKNGSLEKISESNKKKWLEWYNKYTKTYKLETFVKTELSPNPLPPKTKAPWEKQDIENLTEYLETVSDLIQERGKLIIQEALA